MKHSIWLPGGLNTNKAPRLVQKIPSVTEFCCFSQRVSAVLSSCRCHSEHLLLRPLLVYRAGDGGRLPHGPHSSLRQRATSEKWGNRILDVNLIESGSPRRRSPLLLLACSTSSRPGGEAGGWASPRPPPWKQIRSVWAGTCLHKPRSSSGNRLNNDLMKNNS